MYTHIVPPIPYSIYLFTYYNRILMNGKFLVAFLSCAQLLPEIFLWTISILVFNHSSTCDTFMVFLLNLGYFILFIYFVAFIWPHEKSDAIHISNGVSEKSENEIILFHAMSFCGVVCWWLNWSFHDLFDFRQAQVILEN